MRRQTLVIMVKEPRPGRVKTRLGRSVGMTAAAWWFRHQTRRLIGRLQDPRWNLVLAVSPDREGLQSRVWPAHLSRIAQGRGNLGDRMARVFGAMPPGPVCIVGADIPGITAAHIARAFACLGQKEAVFGPAPDGGYWLIGLRRTRAQSPDMFAGVRWSTEHALADTEKTLAGLTIGHVSVLRDVDEASDLH